MTAVKKTPFVGGLSDLAVREIVIINKTRLNSATRGTFTYEERGVVRDRREIFPEFRRL